MIQISPPLETADASAAEQIHKPKPEKKDASGVFAKILAGLLRKAGEKDAPAVPAGEKGAENSGPGIHGAGLPGSEELAALFPDAAGWTKGKKPDKTGAPDSGSPMGTRTAEAKNRKPGGQIPDLAGDWDGISPFPFNLSEIPVAETGARAEGVKAKTALPGNEEVSGGPGLELGFSPAVSEGGLAGEAGPEAEDGELRINRKGKTGDKTRALVFPEGITRSAGEEDLRGFRLSDMKKSGVPEGGREGDRRSAEIRSRDKRRDRVNLEVRDLRTGDERPASPAGTFSAQHVSGGRPSGGGAGDTEITLELRGDNPGPEAPDSAPDSRESRSAQSFEHILARELHENLNGDIVRHASMVLRDNGQGTIRLSLKPESLGNVKIRLEMAENKITGHIVVESEEALRAFEREAHSLEQAFRDSGFDGAKLDMSLAQGGGGAEQRWNGEETGRSFLSERMAASQYALEPSEHPGLSAAEARNGMYTRNGRITVNMLV